MYYLLIISFYIFYSKEYTIKLNEFLFTTLNISNVNLVVKNIEQVTRALTVIPHLQGFDQDIFTEKVSLLITLLCNNLLDTTEDYIIHGSIFVVSIALETLIHVAKDKALCLSELIVKTLLPFAKISKHVIALRTLDIFITAAGREPVLQFVDTIVKELTNHLASPFHEVRISIK